VRPVVLLALSLVIVPVVGAQSTWTRVNTRTDIRTLFALDDGTILAGGWYDGLRSTDGGVTFDTLLFLRDVYTSGSSVPQRDGISDFAALRLSEGSTPRLFASGEDGGYRSDDGGTTWLPGPPGVDFSGYPCHPALARYSGVAASDDGVVVFSGENEVPYSHCDTENHSFASRDGGKTWARTLGGVRFACGVGIHRRGGLAVVDDGVLCAANGFLGRRDLDRTQAWQTEVMPPNNANAAFTVVSGSVVYAGVHADTGDLASANVWRSDDAGRTWSQTGPGLPPGGILAVLALSEARVIAGTVAGAYVSADGGASWQPALDGLGSDALRVYALAVSGDAVFAATETGLYRSAAFAVATDEQVNPLALSVVAAPNPTPGDAHAAVTLAAPGRVRVEVVDLPGRRVALLHDGPAMGTLRLSIDAGAWPAGIYVVRAVTETGAASATLTVAR